jgi:hypothetical protein
LAVPTLVAETVGDVDARVLVEEAEWLEPERHYVGRHYRPVLDASEVVDAEHVPEHDIGVLEWFVVRDPSREAEEDVPLVVDFRRRS